MSKAGAILIVTSCFCVSFATGCLRSSDLDDETGGSGQPLFDQNKVGDASTPEPVPEPTDPSDDSSPSPEPEPTSVSGLQWYPTTCGPMFWHLVVSCENAQFLDDPSGSDLCPKHPKLEGLPEVDHGTSFWDKQLASDEPHASIGPCDAAGEKCVFYPAFECPAATSLKRGPWYAECRDGRFQNQVQGCPISSAQFKENITYVSPGQREKLAAEILNVKLATYNYNPKTVEKVDPALAQDKSKHLGFIIEDNPKASFVLQGRDRVDLYSYLSALVATVQMQQSQIEKLQNEITKLQKTR